MKEKIEKMLSRLREVESSLANSETFSDQQAYKKLTQEHAYLSEIQEVWLALCSCQSHLEENKELASKEKEQDFLDLLQEEIEQLSKKKEELQKQLELLLVPPSPKDHQNTIMELRAGTGGEEASLFVVDCIRMYKLYADQQKWQVEVLSQSSSEQGGMKEYIMVFSGKNVFRMLQFESGTHRVQRVPETESQGRVHTSAITVAVFAEPTEAEKTEINEADLKIDTFRASGAGGQHVNTTDSAVRITHLPTGVVVACQEERSQHKNKEKALRLLSAKITEQLERKRQEETSKIRSSQIGSGDRSERIRTYNFPQNRVSDHRIQLTLYKLDAVMKGDLDLLTVPLVTHYYQQQLQE